MFLVPKKILSKSNSDSLLRNNSTVYNKIRSYMTNKEINSNPVISSALTTDKKITFSLLTPSKSKIISIKGLKNEKKQHLVDRINTFRKVYYNYYKNYKYSLEEMNTLSKENSLFIKQYHKIEEKTDTKKQDKFEEIKKEYEKKHYNLPDIEGNKNLFGGSLLLSNNDTDMKKYIIYGLGTEKSNQKSISYLNKVNKGINDNLDGKKKKIHLRFPKKKQTSRRGGVDVPSPFYAFYKISKDSLKEIMDYKNDINNIKNTIDSIPEIDFFFDADNKNYLNSLKFFDSRKSSANFSTGANLDRMSGHNNSSFCSKREFNASNISSIPDMTRITYNDDKKDRNRNVSFNPNTMISFLEQQKIKGNQLSRNEIPTLTHLDKKPIKKKRLSVIKGNQKEQKKALEKLYKEISTSHDTTRQNRKIVKYLTLRKYDILPKLSPFNLCNNLENMREQICKGKTMKKVIDLRRYMGDTQENISQMYGNELKTTKSMNEMEDKMIKLFSGFKSK